VKVEEQEMRNIHRRVVTGNVNGKAVVQCDERLPAYAFETVSGYEHTLLWVNPTTPDLNKEQKFDRYPDSVVPGPGGTSLHLVTFPPSAVFVDPSFDGEAARKESLSRLPGLAAGRAVCQCAIDHDTDRPRRHHEKNDHDELGKQAHLGPHGAGIKTD